ncbi:MAG: PaaI family thioesterase [Pseudomonadota bacterium]
MNDGPDPSLAREAKGLARDVAGHARDATGEPPYPYQRLVGFEIVAWSEGYARVEMPLREKHANRYGIPHGGVHATLLDTACGFAGSWTGDPEAPRHCMTLSLTVNYIGVATGERLIAEARVVGGGRRSFFANAELRDEHGALVATASATMRYRGEPKG